MARRGGWLTTLSTICLYISFLGGGGGQRLIFFSPGHTLTHAGIHTHRERERDRDVGIAAEE